MNRAMKHVAQCAECERVFDLLNEEEAGEWYYGHDCDTFERGDCDNCENKYDTSSRDGRCGNCGNCADCCEHDSESAEHKFECRQGTEICKGRVVLRSFDIGDVHTFACSCDCHKTDK
jgi:hypothetical protein